MWEPAASAEAAARLPPRRWAKKLNAEWREFVGAFARGDASVGERAKLWVALTLASTGSGPLASDAVVPLRGLAPADSYLPATGAVAAPTFPFGMHQRARTATVSGESARGQRTIVRRTVAQWVHLGTDDFCPCLYWSFFSFCPSTAATTMPPVAGCYRDEQTPETERTLSDCQGRVNTTFKGVLTKEMDGERLWFLRGGLSQMRAVVGPIVERPGHCSEQLRATYWYSPLGDDGPPPLLILLPALWVAHVLREYAQKSPPRHTGACPSMVEGLLVLRHDERIDPWIPIDAQGFTPAELEGMRAELGARAWRLPRKGLRSPERVRLARRFYRAQLGDDPLEAYAEEPYDVFHTQMSAEDCFSGLVVRMVPSFDADDRQPLLAACHDEGCGAPLEEFLSA